MMRIRNLVLWLVAATIVGCTDGTRVVAPLINPATDFDGFDGPLRDLDPGLLTAFARGDIGFETPFNAEDGLGPVFNQASCECCHAADGKAPL